MKILCLVKLVPDVENFRYDYDRNVLIREGVHAVVNPEDAAALAFALDLKKDDPEIRVETVSMAPLGAMPHLEDLVRRGVDNAVLISDPLFVGSDTWVTSRILERFLKTRTFDWVFSGTHTLDGGTAHVPVQTAELLGLPQLSNIVAVDRGSLSTDAALAAVDSEEALLRFEVNGPAVLSFQYSTALKLPYISYENISLDVSDRIRIVTNDELEFSSAEVGLEGSLTKVAKVEVTRFDRKDTVFVGNDADGIETVYRYLRSRGFVES